jgi:uncharacterized protein (TIGR03435 family)
MLNGVPAGPHKFDMVPDGMIVQALPMSFVTEHLALHLNQPVVDRTGLTGDYDFTLKFSPEGAMPDHKEMHGGKEITVHTLPLSNTMTALLAAIEDQLGLKLEPQTIPMPVLIVDRAENPSAI